MSGHLEQMLLQLMVTLWLTLLKVDYDGAYSIGFGDGVIIKNLKQGMWSQSHISRQKVRKPTMQVQQTPPKNPSFLYANNTVVVKSQAAGGAERRALQVFDLMP